MLKYKALFGFFLLLTHFAANASVSAEALAKASGQPMPSLAPMIEKVTPAVVNISTQGTILVKDNPLYNDPFYSGLFNLPQRYRKKKSQSLGSGVIVDAKRGYIVTNNHVVGRADKILVTLRDGRAFEAVLLGTDPETDVAVIQIKAKNLTAVKLADSKKLRVGDFAIAIGNPFGLGQTVTSGIVSALGRSGLGIEGFEDFIQTDASINPGNSGGALVNLRGELIGVNTAILSKKGANVGIGFAIPTNMVSDIMQQLIATGEVKRGLLGVYVQDLTTELANAFGMKQLKGAIVSKVHAKSPAEMAGLKAGDVIVSIGDKKVNNSEDLRNVIGLIRVGRMVPMKIVRNGELKNISAIITAQEQQRVEGEFVSSFLKGSTLGILNQPSAVSQQKSGIEVVKLQRNSSAWNAGLRKGDIIVAANRRMVTDFKELEDAIKRSRRGVLLNILRGDTGLYLAIQ